MKLNALALAAVLASCSTPEGGRTVRPVTPPPAKPSIENRVVDVEDASRKVERSNRALQRQVVDLTAASREASTAATRAESEARRLAEQKTASEEELFNLSKIMQGVAQRNMFLETEVTSLKDKIVEQEELIVEQVNTVTEARAAARATDQENFELRRTIDEANGQIAVANEAIDSANLRAAHFEAQDKKSREQVAALKIYRTAWIVVGVVVAIFLFVRFLLPVVLRYFKPI